jgi:putative ABC transport system ATP-binding protein
MPDFAISAQRLAMVFGGGEARTMAVDDVSPDMPMGRMLHIFGPSGSGKTALPSAVSSMLRPTGGKVLVKSVNIWGSSASMVANFRRHNIEFVFQKVHLFPRLTSAEKVAIPLVRRGVAWREAQETAVKHLDIVGLKRVLRRFRWIGTALRGERQ